MNFISIYVKVNANVGSLYRKSSKPTTLSIISHTFTLKYSLHLFEFAPFQTFLSLIHYLRTGKTGTCANHTIKQENKELHFMSDTNARDHSEPSNTSTWPLAGLYLKKKGSLSRSSGARSLGELGACSATAQLMPYLYCV